MWNNVKRLWFCGVPGSRLSGVSNFICRSVKGFSVEDSFSYLKTIDYSVNVFIYSSLIRTLDICNISFNLTNSDISNNYDGNNNKFENLLIKSVIKKLDMYIEFINPISIWICNIVCI